MTRHAEAIQHLLRARRAYNAIRQATQARPATLPTVDRTASDTALATAAQEYDDAIDALTREVHAESNLAAAAAAYHLAVAEFKATPNPAAYDIMRSAQTTWQEAKRERGQL